MSKIKINKYITSISVSDFSGQISDIVEYLLEREQYCKSLGYEDIEIDINVYHGTVDVDLMGLILETDVEYEKRLRETIIHEEEVAENAKLRAQQEYNEYLKLKQKYESDNTHH
jgi:hypothetical protein